MHHSCFRTGLGLVYLILLDQFRKTLHLVDRVRISTILKQFVPTVRTKGDPIFIREKQSLY